MTSVRIMSQCLAHVAFPLCLGAAIYLVVRQHEVPFATRLLDLGLREEAERLSGTVLVEVLRSSSFVVQHFSDAAWAYALIAFVGLLWGGSAAQARLCWLLAGASLIFAYEVAQLAPGIAGTFDPLDLLALSAGGMAGFFFTRKQNLEGLER